MPAFRLKVTQTYVYTIDVEAFSYGDAERDARRWLVDGVTTLVRKLPGVRSIDIHHCDVAVQEARNEEL